MKVNGSAKVNGSTIVNSILKKDYYPILLYFQFYLLYRRYEIQLLYIDKREVKK